MQIFEATKNTINGAWEVTKDALERASKPLAVAGAGTATFLANAAHAAAPTTVSELAPLADASSSVAVKPSGDGAQHPLLARREP